MKADLHIHSNYSDGVFSVKELLELAKTLDYIAITDHDIISGAIEAYHLQSENTKVIVGLELSTIFNNESIHILGYFSDLTEVGKLNIFLEKQRNMRVERANKMFYLLEKCFKIKLNTEPFKKIDSITRGSIANEIIKQGYPYTKEEIFRKMIGAGCPAYIPSTKMTTEFGIKLIKEANGLAVIAHPILIRNSRIEDIIKLGVDGIEAIYPVNTKDNERKFKKIARKYNLLVTAGSDFHYFNDFKHGNIGQVYLEGEYLETFLNKLEVKR